MNKLALIAAFTFLALPVAAHAEDKAATPTTTEATHDAPPAEAKDAASHDDAKMHAEGKEEKDHDKHAEGEHKPAAEKH